MAETREEHVEHEVYMERKYPLLYWEDDCELVLGDKRYKLVICVEGDTVVDHHVYKGQLDMAGWLGDEDNQEITKTISQRWPEVRYE